MGEAIAFRSNWGTSTSRRGCKKNERTILSRAHTAPKTLWIMLVTGVSCSTSMKIGCVLPGRWLDWPTVAQGSKCQGGVDFSDHVVEHERWTSYNLLEGYHPGGLHTYPAHVLDCFSNTFRLLCRRASSGPRDALGQYADFEEFSSDIRRVFSNAILYHGHAGAASAVVDSVASDSPNSNSPVTDPNADNSGNVVGQVWCCYSRVLWLRFTFRFCVSTCKPYSFPQNIVRSLPQSR